MARTAPALSRACNAATRARCSSWYCCRRSRVIGDDDGVVVVPRGDAGVVLEAAREIHRWEAARRTAVAAGHPVLET